jgi:hypothetical protein
LTSQIEIRLGDESWLVRFGSRHPASGETLSQRRVEQQS